jgi:hypothetical protein
MNLTLKKNAKNKEMPAVIIDIPIAENEHNQSSLTASFVNF